METPNLTRTEAAEHIGHAMAQHERQPKVIGLPEINTTNLPNDQKEVAEHFNALSAELRWFYKNGVSVSFKPTRTGYTMNMQAIKSPRRKT